ncbi:hypothetical protein GGX14DRAFT_574860 [Mycena pura]|uniref:Uncharacterized protein n=1 Tax=Mycena pura TaxID=153505 RepID=A0AAD6Y8P0_9AGAR|nr:hypothetical protein GGX14DRAFT_574860 [Mycena pura]
MHTPALLTAGTRDARDPLPANCNAPHDAPHTRTPHAQRKTRPSHTRSRILCTGKSHGPSPAATHCSPPPPTTGGSPLPASCLRMLGDVRAAFRHLHRTHRARCPHCTAPTDATPATHPPPPTTHAHHCHVHILRNVCVRTVYENT